MSLVFDNPVQPVLALPPDLAVWQQCESVSDPSGRWRLYLHRIGLAALRSWVEEECDQPVHLWPTADPSDIWQEVDGLALTLGQRRILVVLSETIDATTLQVPQEWVDIPGWSADYYVAAHVDVDEQRLALWGYGTHDQIKTQGEFDPRDRTYRLSDSDLIQDFSVFWVAQQLEQLQPASVPDLPSLSAAEAERLIEQLAHAVEPRLELPFEQWGALISDGRWRRHLWQQLGRQRQGIVPVDLGRWVRQQFEDGWRSLESLLPQTPALAFRSAATRDETVSRGKLIRFTATDEELVLGLRVATVEGDRGAYPSDNRQADPSDNRGAYPSDTRRSVRIQLFPSDNSSSDNPVLPNGIILALDQPDPTEPGMTQRLQRVEAGEHDNYIQLPTFRCPVGQRFRVSVQLADAILQEDFVS